MLVLSDTHDRGGVEFDTIQNFGFNSAKKTESFSANFGTFRICIPLSFFPERRNRQNLLLFRSLLPPPRPPPASAQPPHKHVNIAAPPLFGLRLLLRSLHTKIPPLPSFPFERGRKKETE